MGIFYLFLIIIIREIILKEGVCGESDEGVFFIEMELFFLGVFRWGTFFFIVIKKFGSDFRGVGGYFLFLNMFLASY